VRAEPTVQWGSDKVRSRSCRLTKAAARSYGTTFSGTTLLDLLTTRSSTSRSSTCAFTGCEGGGPTSPRAAGNHQRADRPLRPGSRQSGWECRRPVLPAAVGRGASGCNEFAASLLMVDAAGVPGILPPWPTDPTLRGT
jgi:hypothetical protein